MRHEGKVFHYRVSKSPQGIFISKEHPFQSLRELVEYHSKKSDGLVFPLKHPVAKKQAVVLGVSKEADDKWEIDRSEITLGSKLGAGQYGEVYEGTWRKFNKKVAVKTFKEETTDSSEFLKEANVMKSMRHENLVMLLAVCTRDKPMFIITEFMAHGNLLDFLRNEANHDKLDATALMYIASQIASGMAYLESHSCIHRDLAARNCLVSDNLLVKIADFGLSRLLRKEDVYTAQEGAKFPIKWTAPESLSYNVFTTKSDVWAFGIVLWELATYGKTPYPGVDLFSVLEKLVAGYRMPRPEGCPAEIYKLMRECWSFEADQRPTFKEIKQRLESMFSERGSSVQEAVEKVLTIEKGMKLVEGGDDSSMRPPPKRTPPMPKPRPSAATVAAATGGPADVSNDITEVIDMTKSVFRQAQHINRHSTPEDIVDNLRLLATDAGQLIDAARLVARTHPSIIGSVDTLAAQLTALMKMATSTSTVSPSLLDAIKPELQVLGQSAKEVCNRIREAQE